MPRRDGNFYEPVGERIRSTRAHLGVRQEEVSSALGVSQQQFGKYENGLNAIPLKTLVGFANLTRVSIEWLVMGDAPCQAGDTKLISQAPLKLPEREIVNSYRQIENPQDRRVLRRLADVMAQGNKAFRTDEYPEDE